ncbi:MAG: hypothetical protein HC812_09255 [Leptolyngbya sp. RL_3_1]|nr:hypothetical protein [Leptolyngbya sp. RL_3_1]
MDASLLRLLWCVIEETPTHLILGMAPARLCQHLLNKMAFRVCLDEAQHQALKSYITSHTHLIWESRERASICVA